MYNYIRVKLLAQTGNNFFTHYSSHFLWHSRHRNQYFIISFKPADRSTAYPIIYHNAIFWNHCLAPIQCIHRDSSCQYPLHIFKYFFAENQFRSKISAQRLFGYIVFSRSQTTGHKYDINPFHRIVYGFGYFFRTITDRNNPNYLNTGFIQLTPHPCGICIRNLPYKKLITDCDNFCKHTSLYIIR